MRNKKLIQLILATLLLGALAGCTDNKDAKDSKTPGMKCGAGKCGANMFDGKGALAKKKKNILSQMRDNDPRKECVIAAKNTKEAYDCVKHKETNKMSTKCGTAKCGVGKCGDALTHEKMMKETDKTKEPAMKCGAGKCGGDM
ncbi:hypothetical protein JHD49_04120 [Sulfurimonas sp. SAG-AH-194-C21]|nr:hypothetical protein [Sulfurimonas sp. SAG-AH-194-C21]MDF1883117.1 hypothetical protein [Sulfurimonas sp. SAG-AH-194-C21]